ncbi:MAG TPA: radical SAM protein [Thermoanaerobaculia bacterium]|nr:radical SAM protein [Thermoanaerobaculia bacterium]
MGNQLDCVVVGYYEQPLDDLLESSRQMREHSGGYKHLLANTVPFRGKRVRYPELLNFGLREATGKTCDYHVGRLPNLGACYLTSFLRKKGLDAALVNFFNHDQEAFRQILAGSPKAVALTTTFYFESSPIRYLVNFIREHSPDTKIIVGGPHIYHVCSDFSEPIQNQMFSEMGADVYVFDSQGELTLSRVCAALRATRPDLSTVPNLTYTSDNRTFERTPREIENNDMDESSIDWRHFSTELLVPSVQLRTARSCAYKCAFCRYPILAGDLNLTSLDVVERELTYLKEAGVTHLLFIDDTFNIPKNRFKDLCRMMIDRKFDFKWYSYFRCANADDEVFDLAARSGCTGVFLGIESGDNRMLKEMYKTATVDKYRYGLTKLREYGIFSYASFIIGFPGETEESAENTLAFIDEAQPTYYCLESYFHDKKVPIAARAEEFGLTGSSYAWQHDTMDWRRASEIVSSGYHRINGSIPVPLYCFDLWTIGYLMGQGLSREYIERFLRLGAEMLLAGMDAEIPAVAESFEQRLVEALRPSH